MDTTLIIMAAGLGSRFGGGIKQLAKMGDHGEIIMDYSIHDAKEAGFNKVVFIIRKDIEDEFKQVIGDRISKEIKVEYVYQSVDDLPDGFVKPKDRKKPWGTGQAVLCCEGVVEEPFCIINADDYYGKEAFVKMHDFLISNEADENFYKLCAAGFILKNTLSKNGVVTRGIIVIDEDRELKKVCETKEVYMNEEGCICHAPNGDDRLIVPEDYVSMNMWGGYPDFLKYLLEGFVKFLSDDKTDLVNDEYLLPILIDDLIANKKAKVKVLPTNDVWHGITYKEDLEEVRQAFKELIANGTYKNSLWG